MYFINESVISYTRVRKTGKRGSPHIFHCENHFFTLMVRRKKMQLTYIFHVLWNKKNKNNFFFDRGWDLERGECAV